MSSPVSRPKGVPWGVALLACACLAAMPAWATRLPHIIGDHMVLQAGRPAPVWGWGTPGEAVTVRFAGQTARTVTGRDGRWRVTLKPLAASNVPATMTISGRDRLTVSDILVGQVWLASGQSNMAKPVGEWPGQKPTTDHLAELAAADHPRLRLFKVAQAEATTPQDDVQGQWIVSSPAGLERSVFSALGYYFGRDLMRALDAPVGVIESTTGGTRITVGVIESTTGGTRIELRIPPGAFAAYPTLAGFARATSTPGQAYDGLTPSTLWNGMVAGIAPFGVAGAIWYQGESNVMNGDDAALYADKMRALIGGWRGAFGPKMPFLFVQIAPFRYSQFHYRFPIRDDGAAEIRAGQEIVARSVLGAAMVTTSDLVDDLSDIHPRDKRSLGARLAALALARVYSRPSLDVEGPVFAEATRGLGGHVTVRFSHAAGLTLTQGDYPTGFRLVGRDGVVSMADAVLQGDHVVLSSVRAPEPIAVSLGWSDTMDINLKNAAGLPAHAFREAIP